MEKSQLNQCGILILFIHRNKPSHKGKTRDKFNTACFWQDRYISLHKIAKMASRYMMPVTNEDCIPYIDDEDEWKYL